jgi:hypothetical protein
VALQNEYRDYPTTSTSAFGRIFYGQSNRILFSRIVVDDIDALGRCYQRNDSTSSENPDILATDGGEVLLQNSGRVNTIVEFQQGVLAFADNGVWYVFGPQGGFTATEYSVKKVTNFTLISPRAYVNVGSALFFASESGIHQIASNEFGELKEVMVSERKVDDYVQDFVSETMYAVYDEEDKQVVWVDPSTNKWLIHDLRLDSWFPQEFSGSREHPTAVSVFQDQYFVTQSGGQYTFSDLTDDTFEDYGTQFPAYLVTAYETAGDFSKRKGVPLLSAYFKKTETQITDADANGYTFDRPSGCSLSVRWDWHTSDAGGKWSTAREMYNPLPRGYIPSSIPTAFDTGASVVSKKTKVRGTGNAIQVRFEKPLGKDMQLLGYSMEISSRSRQ